MSDEAPLLNVETVLLSEPTTLVWYPEVPLSPVHQASDITPMADEFITTKTDSQLDAEVELTRPWHVLIAKIATEYQVDQRLIKAFVHHESHFKMHAISKKGAIGLMQVMPNTGRRFGFSDLHNPEINLRAGTAYLKWLLAYFGNNVRLTAAAYNAGEGAVKRYGGVPPYQETQRYVANILRYYQRDVHIFSANEKQFVSARPTSSSVLDVMRVLDHMANLWFMPSKNK